MVDFYLIWWEGLTPLSQDICFILSGSWWWTMSRRFSESNHELCVSAGEYSLLSPVGFHYSIDLKKGDPPGLPPDCWDLVILTLTSVSLKRPNEKKVFWKNYFSSTQAISLCHYCPIATCVSLLASSESGNLICSLLHNCLVS